MIKLTIVLIMIALVRAGSRECDLGTAIKLKQPVQICSSYLSCLVERICSNTFRIAKRDTNSLMNRLISDDLYDFTTKKTMVKAVRSRPRRAIADECCSNACSIENIIEYCPPNAKIFDAFPIGDT